MNNRIDEEIFGQDISIEEFDHITDGVEDHVFSESYLKRKESIMKNASHTAKISKLGVKIAAAAAAVVVATPFAVNAATGGDLFNRLWGNEGKENVEVHVETFDDGKTDDEGNPVTYDVTMPRIEYVTQDPDVAARLIGGNISTEPVTCTVGDTTVTVESVVRDGMGIVASYTVEREGGVDCLNYSQTDNEAKGAWFSEDQNIMFGFEEGSGKIWVDLERSTDTKLYCYEYMCDNSALFANGDFGQITDHITLFAQEYTMTRREIAELNREKGDTGYIREEKEVIVPVADKLGSKVFTSADGASVTISPIAMQWDSTGGTEIKGVCIDIVESVKITYADGTEYLVYDDTTANYGYICGNDTGFIALFNRLVDVDNVTSITINDWEFTL
ncbi:MAG: hypothetical protein IKG01_07875 [Lachnospiraceae bacterium]|nr:hypothetical protein [Lachnospiraceae bacterium]